MLALSDCYEHLHFHLAARYYAAGALYAAINVENEAITHLVGQAAFRISDTFYVSREWITYVFSLRRALEVHHITTSNPHDWTKHPYVQSAFAHAAILRAIGLRIARPMIPLIDEGISTWPLPASEQQLFREMSEEVPWSTMHLEEIEERLATELAQSPFSDVGLDRSVTWQAFGIIWKITCVSERNTWLAALEVAAAIQIVQVEFADSDLLIIPSDALIHVELGAEMVPKHAQLPDNGKLAWKITMPKTSPRAFDQRYHSHLIAIILMVLGQATALPMNGLKKLFDERFERGLLSRVFSIRPLREMMEFAQPDNLDLARLVSLTGPLTASNTQPKEADELKWRNGPGPGYSRQRATEYLTNRYRRTHQGLRITLPRIVRDERCRGLLFKLRDNGILDWQILNALLTIVGQWQVEAKMGALYLRAKTRNNCKIVVSKLRNLKIPNLT
jgi:hypothetical protein